ncbi:MAG: TDT family transporter [Solibacillus sp.]
MTIYSKFFARIPLPAGGLMLGLSSLAKLYYSYDLLWMGHVFFTICAFIAFLFIGKVIFARAAIVEELNNPIVAAVSPAVAMSIMMLCSCVVMLNGAHPAIISIWSLAAFLQLTLVCYFSYRFMWRKWQIQNIFPSWFVTYIGLGIIPVTAPFKGSIFYIILYFILVSAVILVPIILYRVLVTKDIPEPAMPLITILAAPCSIILLAYLSQVTEVNHHIVLVLFILSQLFYVFVLWKLRLLLRLPFYPSYAAFTFPLVISATAFYAARQQLDWTTPTSLVIAYLELCIATIIVVYVTIRYTRFIVK